MDDKRLVKLEARVEELEKEMEVLKEKEKEKQQVTMQINQKTKPKEEQVKKSTKEKVDIEKLIGQIWLPRIFIFILIIGVVWGFKMAFDEGYITEPIRVLIGYLMAFGFCFFGVKQIKKHIDSLGQIMLAGSVVIFILTTFSAHVLYGYFPMILAFLLNVTMIGFGLYLANKYNSQPLAVFIGIGGYLIPFLLESNNPNVYMFAGYQLIFYMSLLIFSMKNKMKYLYHVSTVFLHITYIASMALSNMNTSDIKVLSYGIVLQHVFLLLIFMKKNIYLKNQMASIFGSFLITQIWLFGTLDKGSFSVNLALFTITYGLVAYKFFKKDEKRSVVAMSISSFALMFLMIRLIDSDLLSLLIIIEGAITLFLGYYLKAKVQKITGYIIYVIGIVMNFVNPIHEILSIKTLGWIILLLSMKFLVDVIKRYGEVKNVNELKFLKSLFVLTILYFISQVSTVLTYNFSMTIQEMTLSFTWAIFAILSVVYGVTKDAKNYRIFGIVLILITLFKIIFIDIPSASMLVRAILFIGLGGIGTLMSRLFYRR